MLYIERSGSSCRTVLRNLVVLFVASPTSVGFSLTLVCLSLLLFLQFFMLILLIFLAELAAAILAFIFREHVSWIVVTFHQNSIQLTLPWLCLMTELSLLASLHVYILRAKISLPLMQLHQQLIYLET